MRSLRAGILVCAALSVGALSPASALVASAAETIRDDALGFTLTLPDGFANSPELLSYMPNIAHAYAVVEPNAESRKFILLIEKLGGTIGPERLRPEHLPAGSQGQLSVTKWREFEVNQVDFPDELVQGVKYSTTKVQVPLKRQAIQVIMVSAAEHETEMRALLAKILDGLHGESNLDQPTAPAPAIQAPNSYWIVALVAVAMLLVVSVPVGLWFLSKSKP